MDTSPNVPILMVLYESAATQVLYTDGSCLKLAPCGTVFCHEDPINKDGHPLQEKSHVLQRTQYVTSLYRDKVSQAVDFRNLFAERPFLCKTFLDKENEIKLYSVIKKTVWPNSVEAARPKLEYFDDGSVRLTSYDEYASLLLSAHQRDFSVCYLSLVKPSSKPDDRKTKAFEHQVRTKTQPRQNSLESVQSRQHVVSIKFEEAEVPAGPQETEVLAESEDSEILVGPGDPEFLVESEDSKVLVGSEEPKTLVVPENPVALEGSGESMEPAECASQTLTTTLPQFRTSTPIDMLLNDLESENLNSSQFRPHKPKTRPENYLEEFNPNLGSFLELVESKEKVDADGICIKTEEANVSTKTDKDNNNVGCDNDPSVAGAVSDKSETSRRQYIWVTRHVSANTCPMAWRHPFKLALEAAQLIAAQPDQKISDSLENSTTGTKSVKSVKTIEKEPYVISILPEPLPLRCPGQHFHKWLGSEETEHQQCWPVIVGSHCQLLTDPSQGRLTVLVTAGVVYRFIYLPSLTILEIYPGDGSAMISQGFSGHYFSHITVSDGNLVERTYSVKAPPPVSLKYPYSIAQLMDYGSRLLAIATKTVSQECIPVCWKYSLNHMIEPLPLVLLEECSVIGLGRFQAYSNGWVHVVFEDRTGLDMNWDLTQRLRVWLQQQPLQTEKEEERIKLTMANCHSNICRLLLPSGHERLVDVRHPNIYSRYVQPSVEWAQWVNSTSLERRTFYQSTANENKDKIRLVERELKKLNCFDYIVRNTVDKQAFPTKASRNSPISDDSAFFEDKNLSKSSGTSGAMWNIGQKYPTNTSAQIKDLLSGKEMDQNHVKAALLLTSRTIHDIDSLLERK